MTSRERAAAEMLAVLDSAFLRALTEPARLELLRVMLLHGAGDIGSLAARLPQDRSVISRHLAYLERAGIVQAVRQGRRHVYALDGAAFVRTLEAILGKTRELAAICCPPLSAPGTPPAPAAAAASPSGRSARRSARAATPASAAARRTSRRR